MKRISTSILFALLMMTILVVTVYSQQFTTNKAPVVQVLQGGVHQEIPIDITLQISTDGGIQTVTVPLKLDFNLTIGPIDAVDLDVKLAPADQFVSPITVVDIAEADVDAAEIDASTSITTTEEVTKTSE